ncbi:MAG: DASS family sodium-coupled anion symporter [Balneolaceae bacterium]|nr:DASS family sodium-coupled anion symporter [Balneolaceae bacterium]
MGRRQKLGFFGGLALFVLMLWLPAPEGLSQAGWEAAATGALMASWWISEAIPIPVTALVPVVAFPLLGVVSVADAASPYANPLIFLFLGGFVIAVAMQKWELHRRIALNIVSMVGVKPHAILIGFMLSAAFLSMWVSNTATALMMLPIGLSVLELADRQAPGGRSESNFALVLMLIIAYACNIGGMGTIIGTPPNALLAGYMLENYGVEIGFARWMSVGLPLVAVSLPLMYLLLTRVIYPIRLEVLPGGGELIRSQLEEIGDMNRAEMRVAAVFAGTAALWVFRPLLEDLLPGLTDAGIAMGAAVLLFILPAGVGESGSGGRQPLLSWKDTNMIPWGVLILFGGGLSLAAAISSTGLAEWIGQGVKVLDAWPLLLLVGGVVVTIVFLTELTSNTATTAAFLPIMGSVAVGIGQNPLLLVVPVALAASSAFMLPVATPPNAIVYGSERISIPQMSRAGLWLNLLLIVLITLLAFTLLTLLLGVQLDVLPDWAGG